MHSWQARDHPRPAFFFQLRSDVQFIDPLIINDNNDAMNHLRTIILLSGLLCSISALFAQAPSFQQPIFNVAGAAGNEILGVTHDANGSTFFCGKHTDTLRLDGVTLAPGSGGVFFGKASTSVIWAKQGGTGNSADRAFDIAVDQNGDVYVCGSLFGFQTASFNGVPLSANFLGFVTKYDNDGNFLWAQGYASAVYAIAVDNNNAPIVNLGDQSVYRIDASNGALIESSSGTISGSLQNPFLHNIRIDAANNIVVQAGNKVAKFASDFTPVWSTPVTSSLMETFRINLDVDGNVYGTFYGLFGSVTVGSVTKSNFPNGYVYKLDAATGTPLFVDSVLIASNASKIKEVIPDNGNYYISGDGAFNTPHVLRLTPAYSVLWDKTLSVKAPVNDIDLLSEDCLMLGGKHNGTAAFDSYTLTLPNGATSIDNSYLAGLCSGTNGVFDDAPAERRPAVYASVNPSARHLTIADPGARSFEVYNLLGQRLDGGSVSGPRYDFSRLPNGVYFFVLTGASGEVSTLKFVRQ